MAKKVLNEVLVAAVAASLTGKETMTSEGDVFNGNLPKDATDDLPNGLTPAIVESVVGYTSDFVAAGTRAVRDVALAAMKKDKKLTDVQASIPMGAVGSMSIDINKSREGTPPGSTEKQTYFGGNTVKVRFSPGEGNTLLNGERAGIKSAFKEAFDKA